MKMFKNNSEVPQINNFCVNFSEQILSEVPVHSSNADTRTIFREDHSLSTCAKFSKKLYFLPLIHTRTYVCESGEGMLVFRKYCLRTKSMSPRRFSCVFVGFEQIFEILACKIWPLLILLQGHCHDKA